MMSGGLTSVQRKKVPLLGMGAQQIPPLRYPGFPAELIGVGALHASFSSAAWQESGYASVGITIHLGNYT